MRGVAEIFQSYGVLNSEGIHVNGTDKETNHKYGAAYERILEGRRLSAQCVMEVGIADGSSLLAWSEVFPNATCVGLDIHHSDKAHGNRIEFHIGDMRSRADCELAAGGRQFDFVCEDATHNLQDSLTCLFYLWPFVKPGGLYVIEEFANVLGLGRNLMELLPGVQLVDTPNPHGGIDVLTVFHKE